jgi:hypothetical protein
MNIVARDVWPSAFDDIADGVSLVDVAARYGVAIAVAGQWLEDNLRLPLRVNEEREDGDAVRP